MHFPQSPWSVTRHAARPPSAVRRASLASQSVISRWRSTRELRRPSWVFVHLKYTHDRQIHSDSSSRYSPSDSMITPARNVDLPERSIFLGSKVSHTIIVDLRFPIVRISLNNVELRAWPEGLILETSGTVRSLNCKCWWNGWRCWITDCVTTSRWYDYRLFDSFTEFSRSKEFPLFPIRGKRSLPRAVCHVRAENIVKKIVYWPSIFYQAYFNT